MMMEERSVGIGLARATVETRSTCLNRSSDWPHLWQLAVAAGSSPDPEGGDVRVDGKARSGCGWRRIGWSMGAAAEWRRGMRRPAGG